MTDTHSIILHVVVTRNQAYWVLKTRDKRRRDLAIGSGLLSHLIEPESCPDSLLLSEAYNEARSVLRGE